MASTVLLLVQYVRERFFKGGEFRDLAHYHWECVTRLHEHDFVGPNDPQNNDTTLPKH